VLPFKQPAQNIHVPFTVLQILLHRIGGSAAAFANCTDSAPPKIFEFHSACLADLLKMKATSVVVASLATVSVGVTAAWTQPQSVSVKPQLHTKTGPTLAAVSTAQAAIFHISLLLPALQLPPPHLMRHARRVEIGLRQTANSVGYVTSNMMLRLKN
jgi:hypothetical protein